MPLRVCRIRLRGRSSFGGLTALLGLCAGLTLDSARAAAEAPPKPSIDLNVIFISLTNTRADHLGLYGYSRDTSPNLDRLAKKSLVFRNAYSHASWTLPVAVSLFTSRYPFEHGLMNREEFTPLPPGTPSFVDVLKENGYFTTAFVGDRDYSQKFGHTARFDFVFDTVNAAAREDWRTYGVLAQTLPAARDWLRQNRDKKFFLLVQGYDAHCPHAVPKADTRFDPDYRGDIDFGRCYWTFERTKPIKRRTESGEYKPVYLLKTKPVEDEPAEVFFFPEDVRHMIALYDGEIYNADAMLGGLFDDLATLGLEKNTIVVFYADHGDMFGKHGRFMRGGPLRGTFYDDVLRIPLIIRHPGLAPKTIDGLAQVIDIGPTLLDLLGLKSPGVFRGKSLKPLISADTQVNDYVFAGSAFTPTERNPFFHHDSVIFAVRNREWKLIIERLAYSVGPQESVELYDVRKDPEELNDLSKTQPAIVQQLRQVAQTWLKQIDAAKYLPQ